MADDEMNTNQETPQGQEPETSQADRISEMERQAAQRSEALASAEARIAELEAALVESGEKLTQANDSLTEAVLSYKRMVTETNPEVPEDLIAGDSIMAIEESLKQGKNLINRVKQGLEAEIQAVRIPAGAPQRTAPDLSALSPREKIQYSIRR